MPPKKAGGGAKKKTANGYKFPDHLNEGTILTDLAKKQWVLGKTLGKGGFGGRGGHGGMVWHGGSRSDNTMGVA